MSLLGSVLGFALRKFGLLVLLMVALFLGYLVVQVVVPSVREAVTDRERLERVTEERAALEDDLDRLESSAEESLSATTEILTARVEGRIEDLSRGVDDALSEADRLREESDEACGLVERVTSFVLPGNACETAQRAVEAADATLDTFEANLSAAEDDAAVLADPALTPEEKLDRVGAGGGQTLLEREIDATESELSLREAEQESLEEAQSSPAGWVVNQWARSWRWVAAIALLLLVLPGALRTVSYFVLMPVVSRVQRPLHLAEGAEHATAELRTTHARRTLRIDLGDGEVLSARSEFVRPVQGTTRSRLLYDWSSPFISFAAGLYFLSRVTGGDERVTSATLASPDDPDSYLMRIDFSDHPGVVIRPSHVVGVIGEPALRTRWRWSIQSFATWQVRYVMFAGDGSLVVQGVGDVVDTDPRGGSTRMEQNLVMGFDSRLTRSVNRTEVFWPYLRGRTPLVADEFTGVHPVFWQKSSRDAPRNPVTRTFDAVFSALGKVLGF